MTVIGFSRTTGYRHESIPDALGAVARFCGARGLDFVATEDPADLEHLDGVRAVVFAQPSGDVLTPAARAELTARVRAGTGFAGIHAAADAEPSWDGYRDLVGARFRAHPREQRLAADLRVVAHPSTAGLPTPWRWTEEWYAFDENPRGRVDILLTVDEAQYSPAGDEAMGADHPLAWAGALGAGRTWYTALGHHAEAYADPVFLAHLEGGLSWVLGGGQNAG